MPSTNRRAPRFVRRAAPAIALLALAFAAAGPAWGRSYVQTRARHHRPLRFDLMGYAGFGYYDRVGMAGWFMIPIVHDGFIPSLNESLSIEFGGGFELGFREDNRRDELLVGHAFRTAGGVRWDWYLHPQWQVWVSPKAVFHFDLDDNRDLGAFFAPDVSVGAYFHFSESTSLRMEGSPRMPFGVGISFAF